MPSVRNEDFIFSLRPEFRLIFFCARTRINDSIREQIIKLVYGSLNWHRVLEQARFWRLLPLVYYNLRSICYDVIPVSIRQEMEVYYQNNLTKNLVLADEVVKVVSFFRESDIDLVPFKGPVLAEQLYRTMSYRDAGNDLDFFVPKRHVRQAVQLVQKMGYKLFLDHPGLSEEHYLRFKSHFMFTGPVHKPMLELHWDVAPHYFSCKFEEKLQRAIQISFSKMSVRSLEPVDLLQCLCIHLAIHYEKSPFWICDINELFMRLIPSQVDVFINQIKKEGCFRTVMLGIGLAQKLFGTSLPEVLYNEMVSDKTLASMLDADVARMLEFCPPKPSKIQYFFKYAIYLVRLQDTWKQKCAVISSRIREMIKTGRMISTPRRERMVVI